MPYNPLTDDAESVEELHRDIFAWKLSLCGYDQTKIKSVELRMAYDLLTRASLLLVDEN